MGRNVIKELNKIYGRVKTNPEVMNVKRSLKPRSTKKKKAFFSRKQFETAFDSKKADRELKI